MRAVGVSFLVVFLAELGDKSQLLALTMATRYRTWVVAAGIALAAAATQGLSVLVGAALGRTLPETVVGVVGGLLFLGFAAWTWRATGEEPDEPGSSFRLFGGRFAVLVVASALVVAELGDKTMLATVTLAARETPMGVWAGATLGMTAAGLVAAVIGRLLGARVSERVVRMISAGMFAAFGLWMLAESLVRL